MMLLLAHLLLPIAASADFCSKYATRKDCLYAPEPRCSWETTAGNSSCVCALDDDCGVVDLCVLEAATAVACDRAVLPNGAACSWNASVNHCTCKDPNCATIQPSCTVTEHCEDNCEFPCACAAGHCYLIDECWRFDGPQCDSSMWHGNKCCHGHGTGADKGCFLCEPAKLCKQKPPPPMSDAKGTRVGPLGRPA